MLNHDISGEVSLKTLELLVPEFQKFDGVAQFQSTLRGSTDKVKFKSEINVKNAEAKVRSLVQPFENMNIKVLMDDDIVNFTEMSTRFASGKITGSGKAELYSTKVPDLDFQFTFNNPKIQTYPVVFAPR